MSDRPSPPAPRLVLTSCSRDPQTPSRILGTVSVGGYPQRVVLDVGHPTGFVEYVDIPWMLGVHGPSLDAVVDAMACWASGDGPPLPHDLSASTEGPPAFPLHLLGASRRSALDTAAAGVEVDVRSVTRVPPCLHASIVVDGRPMQVVVEIPGRSQEGVMRWDSGPAGLPAVQMHAIYLALRGRGPTE